MKKNTQEIMTMIITDKQMFQTGLLVGQYTTGITVWGNLDLPSPWHSALIQREIKEFWSFIDPTGPRIILCPSPYRKEYIDLAVNYLPVSGDPETHLRKYILSTTRSVMNFFGTIPLSDRCLAHARLRKSQWVTVLGMGNWMEIFS
jgi:DNA-binding transcriptional regulator/RsmH inhibitor MraZ